MASYPKELAEQIRAKWPTKDVDAGVHPLPRQLERLLDMAYHASFLRDEERPVTCRILAIPPSELPHDSGPPSGLLPLAFDAPRRCDEHELRRISPAADAHRAFIGVDEEDAGASLDRDGSLRVWGIVQSGPRWLHVAQGGRAVEPPVPSCLVIRVVRPGHLQVSCGTRLIAELRGGRLSEVMLDVFESTWMPARFHDARMLMASEHRAAVEAGPMLPETDAAALTGYLAQQMVKRIISTIRTAHHGGTVVITSPACLEQQYLLAKYPLIDAPTRRRFRNLVLEILKITAEQISMTDTSASDFYRSATDSHLAELDEGLFELGHLIASLAAIDGAVVLTKRFEIICFGAEIAGQLPNVDQVRRATDLEGTDFMLERVDDVGTRHRSAYRLCAASPDTLVIVVSQDGGARFVAQHRGAVTYWEHGLGDG